MVNNLPTEISAEILGKRMLTVLKTYGLGILSKADLEAALLDAFVQASPSLRAADSYERAEMLRITDQKYRTLNRRAGMWLGENSTNITDHALFSEFLSEAIRLYAQSPDKKEVRVVIDDEMKRRNMQRALERAAMSGLSIAVEISLTGRSLVLRGTDLDRMIDRVNTEPSIETGLKQIIQDKQSFERRKAVLDFLKKSRAKAFESVINALLRQAMSG
jgi:hypothetical protein